jgi:hypothetical protein
MSVEEEKAISNDVLVEILIRKNLVKEDQTRIVDKLRKRKRLTPDEFWSVYESLWQEGPKVKYPNQE